MDYCCFFFFITFLFIKFYCDIFFIFNGRYLYFKLNEIIINFFLKNFWNFVFEIYEVIGEILGY